MSAGSDFIHMPRQCNIFKNTACQLSAWPYSLKHQVRKRGVNCSIHHGDVHIFILNFCLSCRSSKLGESYTSKTFIQCNRFIEIDIIYKKMAPVYLMLSQL